jgi:hypothetical protein
MRPFVVSIASVLFASQAGATDAPAAPIKAETSATKPITRASLLGVDANNDGIRDDIAALVANSTEGKVAAKQVDADVALLPDLSKTRPPKAPPKLPSACHAYMMSSPKDQQRADMRMRQSTNGLPGTHPCDPVVSPLQDRPYEREYLQLGPVTVRP